MLLDLDLRGQTHTIFCFSVQKGPEEAVGRPIFLPEIAAARLRHPASRSCPLDAVVVADVMETDVTYLGTAVGFTRTVLGWAEKVTSRGG